MRHHPILIRRDTSHRDTPIGEEWFVWGAEEPERPLSRRLLLAFFAVGLGLIVAGVVALWMGA